MIYLDFILLVIHLDFNLLILNIDFARSHLWRIKRATSHLWCSSFYNYYGRHEISTNQLLLLQELISCHFANQSDQTFQLVHCSAEEPQLIYLLVVGS